VEATKHCGKKRVPKKKKGNGTCEERKNGKKRWPDKTEKNKGKGPNTESKLAVEERQKGQETDRWSFRAQNWTTVRKIGGGGGHA